MTARRGVTHLESLISFGQLVMSEEGSYLGDSTQGGHSP